MRRSLIVAGLVGLSGVAHADAAVLTESTIYDTGGNRTPGQSFTTPADGTTDFFDAFTWLSGPGPSGGGSLFVLAQPYTGLPLNLSAATPGYLAESNAYAGDQYTFSGINRLTLLPATKYYVYTKAADYAFPVTWDNQQRYVGGEGYFQNPTAYENLGSDFTFRALATEVPEPASVTALVVACVLLGRRRRARAVRTTSYRGPLV